MLKTFKKILWGFLVMAVIMPFSVKAATNVSLSLTCNNSMKKNSTTTCNVYGNFSTNITSITGDIVVDSNYFSVSSTNLTASNVSAGTNVKIFTFTVSSRELVGSSTITINNLSGTDENSDPLNITPSAVTKQIKVLEDNAILSDLKIDDATVSSFSPTKYSYTSSVTKDSVNIVATKASNSSVVTGVGTKALSCGVNTINVVVTAESGDKKTYTLKITRDCEDVTTLKNIILSSGSLDPVFNADTKSYTVNVSKDIDKISITTTKSSDKQKIEGEGNDKALKFGANKFEIKVIAENGNVSTYVVNVNREDGRSGNANLSNITLSDGKLIFDKDTLEYNVKVLNEVTNINVIATGEDEVSKIAVTGGKNLKLGDNTIVIKVTAENEATKEYKITVKRLNVGETIGDNPNIKEIDIKDYDISFETEKENYVLELKNEKKLDIKVVMEDPTSTYLIEGNDNLKNGSVIKITARSEDGTTKVYKIVIKKKMSLGTVLMLGLGSVAIATILIVVIIKISKKSKKEKTASTKEEVKEITVNEVKDNPYKKEEIVLEKEPIKEVLPNQFVRRRVIKEELDDVELLDEPEVIDLTLEEKPKLYERRITTIIDQKKEENIEAKGPYNIDEVLERSYRTREEKNTSELDESEGTKICSICGHRVARSLRTCPYCRRTW